jgi:hypothetical protein
MKRVIFFLAIIALALSYKEKTKYLNTPVENPEQ